MPTAREYRAFARRCIAQAERAEDIERRKTLLEMASSWTEAAALLDRSVGLAEGFNKSVIQAHRNLVAVLKAAADELSSAHIVAYVSLRQTGFSVQNLVPIAPSKRTYEDVSCLAGGHLVDPAMGSGWEDVLWLKSRDAERSAPSVSCPA
jgi:hypothetical protein